MSSDKLGSGIRMAKTGAPVGLGIGGVGGLMVYLTDAFGIKFAVITLVIVMGFAWMSKGGAADIRRVINDLRGVETKPHRRRSED